MANEGIMALPDMQGMQAPPAPQQEPVYVSSADTYDAALTALGLSTNDPSQAAAVRQAVRESIADLDLTATEAADLIDVFEYLANSPSDYPRIRQQLIDSDMMEADDLPEEYDPAFIGIALMAINEHLNTLSSNASAVMDVSPTVAGLPPMEMARGGLADMAQYLASKGRRGDTMLAHITPQEAAMLRRMGGSGTINPDTGLPEFFLKKVFSGIKNAFKKVKDTVKKVLKSPIGRILATVALTVALPGIGTAIGGSLGGAIAGLGTAATAGIAAGAVTLVGGGSLKDALVSSAMGYFGGGGAIGSFNPSQIVAGQAASALGTAATGALAKGIGAGVATAGTGILGGMKPKEAATAGLLAGVAVGAKTAYQNARAAAAGQPPAGQPPTGPRSYAYNEAPQGARFTPGSSAIQEIDLNTLPQRIGTGPGATSATAAGNAFGMQGTENLLPPSTFFSRAGDFVKSLAPGGASPTFASFRDAFLVNPNIEAGTSLLRYAPAVATGLGLSAATGGFKQEEVAANPLYESSYTGEDYIRDNPQLFTGSLQPATLQPYNPVVQTPSYGLQGANADAGQIPLFTVPMPQTAPQVPVYNVPQGAITNMPGGIPQPYNLPNMYQVPRAYAQGGAVNPMAPRPFKHGGETHYPRKTGPINGPGTGTSDSIPAMLSDGEFVMTARAVRNAGGGSRRKGARRMYKLMKMLEGGKVG